jgi:hypothetical protein
VAHVTGGAAEFTVKETLPAAVVYVCVSAGVKVTESGVVPALFRAVPAAGE